MLLYEVKPSDSVTCAIYPIALTRSVCSVLGALHRIRGRDFGRIGIGAAPLAGYGTAGGQLRGTARARPVLSHAALAPSRVDLVFARMGHQSPLATAFVNTDIESPHDQPVDG
jgi:hypothetical protein